MQAPASQGSRVAQMESENPHSHADSGYDSLSQYRTSLHAPPSLPQSSHPHASRTTGPIFPRGSQASTRERLQAHLPQSSRKRALSPTEMVMDEDGYYPGQRKSENKPSNAPVMDEWGYYPGQRKAEKKARKPRKVLMDEWGYPTGETRSASSSSGDDAPLKKMKGKPRGRAVKKMRQQEELEDSGADSGKKGKDKSAKGKKGGSKEGQDGK
ncbi:MAG: hypothetical protein Q9174_005388 [Haloplaca sp. 1 TL-2023]